MEEIFVRLVRWLVCAGWGARELFHALPALSELRTTDVHDDDGTVRGGDKVSFE